MITMTYEEKVANDLIVAGTPDYLVECFDYFKRGARDGAPALARPRI